MAQGLSTKSSSRCGGLGPVGCQQRTLSLSVLRWGLGSGESKMREREKREKIGYEPFPPHATPYTRLYRGVRSSRLRDAGFCEEGHDRVERVRAVGHVHLVLDAVGHGRGRDVRVEDGACFHVPALSFRSFRFFELPT